MVTKRFIIAWIISIALLASAGITYQYTADKLHMITSEPIQLPVPLKEYPMEMAGWTGKDSEISDTVLAVAKNDDYISRIYTNSSLGQTVTFYVAFTARPRTMRGHRPRVCYVNSGFNHLMTEKTSFKASSGEEYPCLLHRFEKSGDVYVLNYYIVNGTVTNEEGTFGGIGFRTPNLDKSLAIYVAQIQISSNQESAVRNAARDLTDKILDFLPDEEGTIVMAKDNNVN